MAHPSIQQAEQSRAMHAGDKWYHEYIRHVFQVYDLHACLTPKNVNIESVFLSVGTAAIDLYKASGILGST